MSTRSFFLVAGGNRKMRLAGSDQAHILTPENGYTVKSIISSNTFLVRKGDAFFKATHILDLVENSPDLETVYNSMPVCSVWNASEGVDIQQMFHLGDAQTRKMEKDLRVLRTAHGHARVRHEDVVKLVCYMNSMRVCRDFHARMDTYPPHIKSWALDMFSGSCIEIGFYCLADCREKNRLDAFLDTWRGLILDEADVDSLAEYTSAAFLPKDQKTQLLKHLESIRSSVQTLN